MTSKDPPESSPTDRALAIEGLLAYDFSLLGDIVARREADLRKKVGLSPATDTALITHRDGHTS